MRVLLFMLCCLFVRVTTAQVFTLKDFMQTIAQYHPVMQRITLLENEADANLQMTRGVFDPYIESSLAQKEYADKLYYRMWNSTLTIPVWSGIDVYAGLAQNDGIYIDPSNTIPDVGLYKAGIKADVLQGLLTNRRQTDVAQAKIMQESNANEQMVMRNRVYAEALTDYFNWSRAYQVLQLYQTFAERAQVRYNGVVAMHRAGDIPAVDTLEAFIQLQDRLTLYNDAFIQYVYALQTVNGYLWNSNTQPVRLQEDQIPEQLDSLQLFQNLPTVTDWLAHPLVRDYQFALQSLDLEERLKKQYVLPKLSLNYGVLMPVGFTENVNPDQYQFGMSFQYPLFTRNARGSLELTRIKQRETDLKRVEKLNELQLKSTILEQEVTLKREQLSLYTSMQRNALTLLQAEETKFSVGESSLFLVNARELSYLNSAVKQVYAQFTLQCTLVKQLDNTGNVYTFITSLYQ